MARARRRKGHFNFPKFHVLSHWVDHIRAYGSPVGYNSSAEEAMHKEVKAQYGRTNKRDNYQEQMLWHCTRKLKLVSMSDILLYDATKAAGQVEIDLTVHATRASKPWQLQPPRWPISPETKGRLKQSKASPKYWRRAIDIVNELHVPDFLDALGALIRRKRSDCDRESNGHLAQTSDVDQTFDRREEDSTWVEDCLVCIHPSITCWKRTAKTVSTDALSREVVRCSHAWGGKDDASRQDWVWLQDYIPVDSDDESDRPRGAKRKIRSCVEGTLVGQLLLIISVQDPDHDRYDKLSGKLVEYTGAFIDVLQWRNDGIPHDIHGLIEADRASLGRWPDQRRLGSRQFWDLTVIKRSAHVLPSDEFDKSFYINNYIDWEMYNKLYNLDWETKGMRQADKAAKMMQETREQRKRMEAADAEDSAEDEDSLVEEGDKDSE